jgi:cyclophilin family peptidyl-prolyl cis-trans isomerase
VTRARRLPYWAGPGAVILVALAGLATVVWFGPCTRLEDAVGKKRLRAPPCTVVEIKHVYVATLDTSLGRIRLVMQPRLAPKSVNNFVFLARAGFYDGTTFHRVDAAEGHALVQGGDPTGSGNGDAGYKYKELATPETRYVRGVVAMASSVRSPGLNGSQFFIVVKEYPELVGANGLPSETFFALVEPNGAESFATLDRMVEAQRSGTAPLKPIVLTRVTVEDVSVAPTPSPTGSPSPS